MSSLEPVSEPQRQALLDAYPYLQPQTDHGRSVVAKNIKAMIKHLFPELSKITGKLDVYAGGSSVHLTAVDYERNVTDRYHVCRELLEQLSAFSYGNFDGMTDSFHADTDPERRAFRSVFGGTSYIFLDVREPTQEEKDAWLIQQAKALSKKMPKASQARKGPGRI